MKIVEKEKECERGRNREWICWWNFEEERKKERKRKCNIQEIWEDKSNVIYSKEVVSLIIHGNTFYFYLYPLFLIPPLQLHYVPMKVLFDLKEGMFWILTWLINVCGVIFLLFGILSPFFILFIHEILVFVLHYSSHICLRVLHPFWSYFICWVLTPVRFELKHIFGSCRCFDIWLTIFTKVIKFCYFVSLFRVT